ncbi:ribosomal RNA large subunit methyltransferase A [Bacillus sp. JCM 19046]|nr:ribosomal RNA large subunit methyltransferase A [Bacillus sp. JCM 19045]GAF17830.1 ribosomal RNA large subunit methyltransferase A [Bacillus sp. JCM 19046]
MSLSKKEKAIQLASAIEGSLRCPICQTNMLVADEKRVVCEQQHSFDFAKQGYLNFLTNVVPSHYDAALFESRQETIMETGLFNPLHEQLFRLLDETEGLLLDAGCGEGSHLQKTKELIPNMKTVGLDLAKEGIQKAAKSYSGHLWIVGDLANIPLANQSTDVILNILSPSNYKEFKRVLKQEGLVIKVVPQVGYLQELRDHFFSKDEKKIYSNEKTVTLFREQFTTVKTERLTYTRIVNHSEISALAEMTPLGWSTADEQRQSLAKLESLRITIDLDVLIGRMT